MRPETCIRTGALLGGLAVGLGAFAAHGMADRFAPDLLVTFEKGVRYQFFHALAVLLCGLLANAGHRTGLAAALFTVGCVLFSGSLYLRVWLDVKGFGMVTPFGGVAFLVGWIVLAWRGARGDRRLEPTRGPS
ncbi:MAG: DUF423 domain-containing protein [Planctomycetes bacterium]|nr:DUF423 domain-containing protein [Planctomycetota bacterium]